MLDNNASLKELIDTFQLIDNDIIDRGLAQTVTPSTSNKVLPKGNYRGDITVKGDANLIAANILSGKSIFGVSGNANPRMATGSFTASVTSSYKTEIVTSATYNCYVLTINNLAFVPRVVIATCDFKSGIYASRALMVYSNNRIFVGCGDRYEEYGSEWGTWVDMGYNNYGVTSSGVKLPLSPSSDSSLKNWNWIAYE